MTASGLVAIRQQRTILRVAHAAPRFTFPRCQRCDRTLTDRHGNPSWEILDGQWVCREVCCGPLPIRR